MQFLADFGDYEPWSGATSTAERIKDAGKWDELESHLEECFSEHTPTATEINDYLWFQSDDVYKALGMKPDSPDTKDAAEFAEEWCDDNAKHLEGWAFKDGYLEINFRDLDANDEPTGDVQTETMDAEEVAKYMLEDNAEFDEEGGTIEYW